MTFCDITPCSPVDVDRRRLVSCLPHSPTLKMEAACSTEKFIDSHQTTRHYISEGSTYQSSLREPQIQQLTKLLTKELFNWVHRKANSRSSSQVIRRTLRNPNVPCRVHTNRSLVLLRLPSFHYYYCYYYYYCCCHYCYYCYWYYFYYYYLYYYCYCYYCYYYHDVRITIEATDTMKCKHQLRTS
jgi:hypothetical protein